MFSFIWKSIHFEFIFFFAVRWCTVSDVEEQKCLDLAGNATARNIRGQLLCVRGQSPTDCMKQIKVVGNCFPRSKSDQKYCKKTTVILQGL